MNDIRQPLVSGSIVTMLVGIFVLFIVFVLILEQIGASQVHLSVWMVCFGIGIYIFSGIYGSTMRYRAYLDAGKCERSLFVGMAITAGVFSGGLLLIQSGAFLANITGFINLFLGILGGLALMTILFAAALARSAHANLSSVLFPNHANRIFSAGAALIVAACSLCLLFGQLKLLTLFAGKYFGLGENTSVVAVLSATTICITLGGMRSLGLVRVLMLICIAISLFSPLIWLSFEFIGNPVPQFPSESEIFQPLTSANTEPFFIDFISIKNGFDQTIPSGFGGMANTLITVIVVTFGVAALPHLLQHYFTVTKGRRARHAGMWSFWLTFAFLLTIPAIAFFAQFNIYNSLSGIQIGNIQAGISWLFNLSGNGTTPLFSICGEGVDSTADILRACDKSPNQFINMREITINGNYLVIGFGDVTQLPSIFVNLFLLASMMCILSTVDGLLLVITNTVTEGIFIRSIRPKSPPGTRMFMNRCFVIATAVLAGLAYPGIGVDAGMLFIAAIAISCSTLFPLLVCRLWSNRFSDRQLGLSMIAAFITSAGLLLMTQAGAEAQADGIADNRYSVVVALTRSLNTLTDFASGLAGVLVFVLSLVLQTLFEKYASQHRKNGSANV